MWMILILNQTSSVELGIHGWIALGLGTFFSIVIGCGLMTLMFISSRHGHDEAASETTSFKLNGAQGRVASLAT